MAGPAARTAALAGALAIAAAALVLCLLSPVQAYAGTFVAGAGDDRFLQLLDIARRQYSSAENEYQTVLELYRGDWDGLVEGIGWAAWWTQNSYGPTMAGLPVMDAVTWHATQHSMAWWFDSIGNGTKHDAAFGTTRFAHGQIFSPDGALCDAAVPCGPTKDCCAYKQGDGNVPMHDWSYEEYMSGVAMVAEQILVGRNASAAAHYLPLFLRTSNSLEARRNPETSYTTFLTGPSSNLLAPSFGGGSVGGGYGGWAALAGLAVTYIAALERLIEVAALAAQPELVQVFTVRRDLTKLGLPLLLAPDSHSYFVRSVDRNGTVHGVRGAAKHGYFEAAPNHDAVAFRVVDDALAESIMATFDALDAEIRPNVFVLPNTDAGGGVGYDDMLCGTGKECGGIFEYGTWVNGGVWTTAEARAILAYFRTGRQARAAASMEQMLSLYISSWRMDAPLPDFGRSVWWKDKPICLTIDAFGVGAALLRGIVETLYSADQLVLIPHLPANITALELKYPIRWGPYLLFVSTAGMPASGIGSVTVNGTSLSSFNATAITLDYASLPAASPAAVAAVTSDVSTASTALLLNITFKTAGARRPSSSKPRQAEPATKAAITPIPCADFAAAHKPTAAVIAAAQKFVTAAEAKGLRQTVPVDMAVAAADFLRGFAARCAALNSGAYPPLRTQNATLTSLESLLNTAEELFVGLNNTLNNYRGSADPMARELAALWPQAPVPHDQV